MIIDRILSITLVLFLVACGGGDYSSDSPSPTPTPTPAPSPSPFTTILLSKNSSGIQGNASSSNPSLSDDGRYVAFESEADNLVLDDTNQTKDIFIYDMETGEISRASVNISGVQGNAPSSNPSLSDDGRYVAFESEADNLVLDDTNQTKDIFIYDMETGEISRASVNISGVQGNAPSSNPSLSDDGRYVAFESEAYNLVPNDWNGLKDIFVHDRETGETSRVSVDSGGRQAEDNWRVTNSYLRGTSKNPGISGDGGGGGGGKRRNAGLQYQAF